MDWALITDGVDFFATDDEVAAGIVVDVVDDVVDVVDVVVDVVDVVDEVVEVVTDEDTIDC